MTIISIFLFYSGGVEGTLFRDIIIIDNHVKNKKYGDFVSISSLTDKWEAQIKKLLQF